MSLKYREAEEVEDSERSMVRLSGEDELYDQVREESSDPDMGFFERFDRSYQAGWNGLAEFYNPEGREAIPMLDKYDDEKEFDLNIPGFVIGAQLASPFVPVSLTFDGLLIRPMESLKSSLED